MTVQRVLVPGSAQGEVLKLVEPVSFWGGVDPGSGRLMSPRHPQFGASIVGKILAMERVIGSSSGSAVLLELMMRSLAPAAILLVEEDAIIPLGVTVGREMQYGSLPVATITIEEFDRLPDGAELKLSLAP